MGIWITVGFVRKNVQMSPYSFMDMVGCSRCRPRECQLLWLLSIYLFLQHLTGEALSDTYFRKCCCHSQ